MLRYIQKYIRYTEFKPIGSFQSYKQIQANKLNKIYLFIKYVYSSRDE